MLAELRSTFRSLCHNGDCNLEYATQASILFSEGVAIAVKPPRAEWSRLEQLSGGQQALVAVALNLSLHQVHMPALFCSVLPRIVSLSFGSRAIEFARCVAAPGGRWEYHHFVSSTRSTLRSTHSACRLLPIIFDLV